MAAPRKNDGNVTIQPTISTSTAKTSALAASIGVRRGTASSDARMTPVEYSLVMTSTPRTQMVSWPNSSPDPRIVLTGSALICARDAAPLLSHCRMVSQVNRPVKPKVTTTSRTSDQTVERTDRIFVHSDSSRRPNPAAPDTAGVPEVPGRAACTGGLAEVTRSSPGQ